MKWKISLVVTLFGIALPLLVSLAVYVYQVQPRPKYISIRYDQKGHTVLTFRNESMLTAVAITCVTYTITDPATLARIAVKHPKPPPGQWVESANPSDDSIFEFGNWQPDGTYSFTQFSGIHIPERAVNDIRIGVVNQLWAGENWLGTLDIYFNGSDHPYTLKKVSIRPQSRK